jgi:hypothetical protein
MISVDVVHICVQSRVAADHCLDKDMRMQSAVSDISILSYAQSSNAQEADSSSQIPIESVRETRT